MGSHLILTGEIISLCLPCHQLLPGQLWIGAENVLGRKVGEDMLVSNIGGGKVFYRRVFNKQGAEDG